MNGLECTSSLVVFRVAKDPRSILSAFGASVPTSKSLPPHFGPALLFSVRGNVKTLSDVQSASALRELSSNNIIITILHNRRITHNRGLIARGRQSSGLTAGTLLDLDRVARIYRISLSEEGKVRALLVRNGALCQCGGAPRGALKDLTAASTDQCLPLDSVVHGVCRPRNVGLDVLAKHNDVLHCRLPVNDLILQSTWIKGTSTRKTTLKTRRKKWWSLRARRINDDLNGRVHCKTSERKLQLAERRSSSLGRPRTVVRQPVIFGIQAIHVGVKGAHQQVGESETAHDRGKVLGIREERRMVEVTVIMNILRSVAAPVEVEGISSGIFNEAQG
ncbi:hypothetical protein BKA83DRAFT_4129477 [Pisolithus microcarpus]|nr:hypothetical protein BKA83DRAFT_4129477 [Pisolithus microcarpus]